MTWGRWAVRGENCKTLGINDTTQTPNAGTCLSSALASVSCRPAPEMAQPRVTPAGESPGCPGSSPFTPVRTCHGALASLFLVTLGNLQLYLLLPL